jgi:predicted nucleic acid-binding protein
LTAAVPRGLLDAGVFIALESELPIDAGALLAEGVISPVTIAELQAGVLAATDVDTRARRLATLEGIAGLEVIRV